MPPDYVARARGHAARVGPDRRRDGRDARGRPRRRRRLRRRRHGRHELRPLPRPRRPARDQDRLELALPLLHRAADGRRAERRRGRRLDRAGAPGRAARRARNRPAPRPVRSATAAAARCRPSPTPTRCSATSPPTVSRAGACSSTSTRPRTRSSTDVAEPLGIDVVEAAWGIERIVNANMANATRKVLAGHGADARELALIAYGGNGAVHAWAIARGARHRHGSRAEGRARVLGARRARRRLRGRPRALLRDAALAGRPRPRAHAHVASSRRGHQGARAGRPRRRPRPSRRSTRRCATRARTST